MVNANVTVIVPVYNVENYVEKCLNSILNQTYKDITIMAVNDGSTDNSVDVIKKISDKDDRIQLINKTNGGYGSVLEYCIKRIHTKYFIICDPDDWLAPNAIEDLYTFAEQNKLDITVGDKYNVYQDNGEQKYITSIPKKLNIIPNKIYTDNIDIQKFVFSQVSPHAKLFKTEVAKNIRIPHHVSYTDLVLYIISLSRSKRVAYYNKALAYYLIDRPGNTTTSTRASIINDYVIGWQYIFDQLLEWQKKSNDNIDILLYRLFYQIQVILAEYVRVINKDTKNKYYSEILTLYKKLTPYKKNIIKGNIYFTNPWIIRLSLNDDLRNIFLKLYIKKIS